MVLPPLYGAVTGNLRVLSKIYSYGLSNVASRTTYCLRCFNATFPPSCGAVHGSYCDVCVCCIVCMRRRRTTINIAIFPSLSPLQGAEQSSAVPRADAVVLAGGLQQAAISHFAQRSPLLALHPSPHRHSQPGSTGECDVCLLLPSPYPYPGWWRIV